MGSETFITKQRHKFPKFIPSLLYFSFHSCISILINTKHVTQITELIHQLQTSTVTIFTNTVAIQRKCSIRKNTGFVMKKKMDIITKKMQETMYWTNTSSMWPIDTLLKTWCSQCERLMEHWLQQVLFSHQLVQLWHQQTQMRSAERRPADLVDDHVLVTYQDCSSPPVQHGNVLLTTVNCVISSAKYPPVTASR